AAAARSLLPEAFATFTDPPDDARPMVRWWWFGAGMSTADIDDQLASIRRSGLGGLELAFVYPLDPAPGPAFLSPDVLPLAGPGRHRRPAGLDPPLRARRSGARLRLPAGSRAGAGLPVAGDAAPGGPRRPPRA